MKASLIAILLSAFALPSHAAGCDKAHMQCPATHAKASASHGVHAASLKTNPPEKAREGRTKPMPFNSIDAMYRGG